MLSYLRKNKLEALLLAVIFFVTIFLRIPNLGYSDYIGDEHKAFIELDDNQTLKDFFLNQRKGPMQFIVSYVPYLLTQDFHNEFAQRLPFTIFGISSVFIFYFLVKKLTKDKWIAFISSFLFCVNGFIVGFARIAQYQNLNLFFSLLALFFYSDFLKPGKNILKNTMLGTLFFCVSILSHWDAIFVLIPIIYFVISFVLNKGVEKDVKRRVLISNLILGSIILLPYLLPYTRHQVTNYENKQYFERRVEIGHINYKRYKFLIELYNPFIFLPLALVLGGAGIFFIKSSWVFILWFGLNYGLFEIFVRKPGTHIYNFLIPVFVLVGISVVKLFEFFRGVKFLRWLKYILIGTLVVLFVFLTYQSYMIFVDNSVEYPWARENFMDFICRKKEDRLGRPTKCSAFARRFKTRKYSIYDKAPLFGFPLRRNWDEINDFINEENRKRGEGFKFISNEVKTIADWYVDVGYGIYGTEGFYAVGVKQPLSFVNDWNFPQFGGKETVYEIEKEGEVMVRIYRVELE